MRDLGFVQPYRGLAILDDVNFAGKRVGNVHVAIAIDANVVEQLRAGNFQTLADFPVVKSIETSVSMSAT